MRGLRRVRRVGVWGAWFALAGFCTAGCGSGNKAPVSVMLTNSDTVDADGIADGDCATGLPSVNDVLHSIEFFDYFTAAPVASFIADLLPGTSTTVAVPTGTYTVVATYNDLSNETDQCSIDDPVIISGSSYVITFQK